MTDQLTMFDLKTCRCCKLVDTQVEIHGVRKCALCREFCSWTGPCVIVAYLDGSKDNSLYDLVLRKLNKPSP